MNKQLLIFFMTFYIVISNNSSASTISRCIQPDGTIEFTNKGCSKANSLHSKKSFTRNFTQSHITTFKKNKSKRASFNTSGFIHLQNKMIKAQTLPEMEKHAQTITDKIRSSAQQGKINTAFNMVAATYAKLSKYLKKRQWEGQSVEEYTLKIRSFFEEILITQSTVSTAEEFNRVIQTAWKKYQVNTLESSAITLSEKR